MDCQSTRTRPAKGPALLPSRSAALAAIRDGLAAGPVLLTGGAGVGKTLLALALAEADSSRRWIVVDAALGLSPEEFLVSVVAAAGEPVPTRGSTGAARLALASAFAASRADGRPIGLILDEAHLAPDDVLEEVRLLTNRLGRGDGPEAILISGQTPLARRMDVKPLDALESRLATRVHLLPVDLDEAATLVGGLASDEERLERWHRDSGGNPARLRRLAAREAGSSKTIAISAPEPESDPASEPMIPAKPPLRVEDGLIEVGWDSDEIEPYTPVESVVTPTEGDEPVADHYAALQAWDEWAKNQGRSADMGPADPADEFEADDVEIRDRSPLSPSGPWADGRQGFAPYSQLFSRVKPLQGAE